MDTVPLAQIQSALDPQFNGVLVEAFGLGIYTSLVFKTILKLYLKGGKLRYCFILMILWITGVICFTAGWVQSRAAFVANNRSPIAIIMNIEISAPYDYIPTMIGLGISDAIIVWRCYILWQSKLVLSMLIMLLCTMITLGFYANLVILTPLGGLIQAFSALSSFITTLSATFLIALKIRLVTSQTHRYHRYAKIIEILVQSATILSIVQLPLAILPLMSFVQQFDLSTTRGNVCYQLTEYLLNLQIPIAGIAPTLIALRVAQEGSQPEVDSTLKAAPLSRLTFRRTPDQTYAEDNEISSVFTTESV